MQDHTTNVFVVATANSVDRLPPELSRAERFDGVFFVDLPSASQKARIWDIWLQAFELEADQPKPKTENWTGAEIRACCRLAALLDVPLVEAAQNVVPIATTASESVEGLRKWARGRCLDADRPGIYGENFGTSRRSRQSSCVDPLAN
jgi:SpoVK/Ycf46/Vps4 family AAA+-type ATPase